MIRAALAGVLLAGPALADPVEDLRADLGTALDASLPAPLARAAIIALDPGFRDRPAPGSPITRYLARTQLSGVATAAERREREIDLAAAYGEGLTHDEILAAWGATAYFGAGCFGAAEAGEALFGLSPDDMQLADALTLMAVLPAPARLLRDPAGLRLRYDELVAGAGVFGEIGAEETSLLRGRGPTPADPEARCGG